METFELEIILKSHKAILEKLIERYQDLSSRLVLSHEHYTQLRADLDEIAGALWCLHQHTADGMSVSVAWNGAKHGRWPDSFAGEAGGYERQ